MIGQRFGHLVVTDSAPTRRYKSGKTAFCYVCKCDCGNEKVVAGSNLRSGGTISCGCARGRKRAKE
jgi:hypothetical protein